MYGSLTKTYPSVRYASAVLALLRPYNALPPITIFCVAYMLGSNEFSILPLILGILIIFLSHSAATIWNDVEDFNIDRSNGRTNPILVHKISRRYAYFAIVYLFLLGLITAINYGGLHDIIFLTITFIMSWAYSNPPLRFSFRPAGSIVSLALLFGVIPYIYGLILSDTNGFAAVPLLLCAGFFFQRFSVSLLKDFKDIKGDKLHQKETFLIHYGKTAASLISFLTSLAGLCLILVGIFIIETTLTWIMTLLLITFVNLFLHYKIIQSASFKAAAIRTRHVFVASNVFNGALLICLISSY